MSYQLTDIWLYGVSLTYEEALPILEHAGHIGFLNESEDEFKLLREDFVVDPFDLKIYYEDLQVGLPVNHLYKAFESFVDFFDYFGFCRYQVPARDRDTIPSAFDKQRNIQFHRLRYYADLFCEDADSRGDSLRIMPDRPTIYGIYIASDGYAYRDNIRDYDTAPRIEANFDKHCRPVLEKFGLARTPTRVCISQMW
ncbi:MAG TPA: hypothetical protein PK156_00790 [Polyangium sp.]|nr:hypothetical protein [Polyangium sp.]